MGLESDSTISGDDYTGQHLDNVLAPYGLTRIRRGEDVEDDDSFRERAFRELVLTAREGETTRRTVALEILFQHRQDAWDPNMKDLGLKFIRKTSDKFISSFVLNLPEDRRFDMMRGERAYEPLGNAMRYLQQRWEMSSSYPR